MLAAPSPTLLAPVLADLGAAHDVLASLPESAREPAASVRELGQLAEQQLSATGLLLLLLEGQRSERDLARWRDALWPLLHVIAVYQLGQEGILRRELARSTRLRAATGIRGALLVARRSAQVLSPGATQQKFDQNAAGWDTARGQPGYAHFRWMRRYVARFAGPLRPQRVLDFGCGAGWVGIEAALQAQGAELCAFDASPEMVRHAEANARAAGIQRFSGRTGFGEEPPFPAAGEPPFDLVLCSGVLSFSPDQGRFLDGLLRALAPGGTLVLGDVQRESRGMQRRRANRPLLPIRELNARTAQEIAPELERRGLVLEARRGYQLSWPLPQILHWNETRLRGALDLPLLALNRTAGALLGGLAPRAFDSWVLRARRPG